MSAPTSPTLLYEVLCSLSKVPAACSDVCLDHGIEPGQFPDVLLAIEKALGVATIRRDGAVRLHPRDVARARGLCEEWWDVHHGTTEAA